jgi:DNA-binding winged helix-turn-helix (wHTH) protein/tetratricopeptide (TPR) repeat protein
MTPLAEQDDLTLGAMTLRASTCELVHPAGVETVEPQVMRVLLVLARQPGRVVSRDAIVDQAWAGRAVSEDAINRVLSRLRRLSTVTGVFQLGTVRKVGYRLEPVAAPGDRAAGEVHAPNAPVPNAPVPNAPAPNAPIKNAPSGGAGRRMGRIVALLALVALVSAGGALLAARFLAAPGRAAASASVSQGPTLALFLAARDPIDAATAAALDDQMRMTLSHMQGLRLIADGSVAARPTDLVLKGSVGHAEGRPVIDLTLGDGRSGVRLWSARFDGRATLDPSAQERAVSAAARFLAVRLGDGLAGRAAAREPGDPEVERLVVRARRSYAASNEARHQRDWAGFARLTASADTDSNRALALDPASAGALMVRYQIEMGPQYPRPGETQAAFQARLGRAASYLSRALAADPDDPEVLVAAGEDYRQSLRWDDAERLLERAVAIDPNSPDANTWYAYHLGLMGRCAQGLKHARIAAALAPGDTWRQLAIPRLLHCDGRRGEAAGIYHQLQARDPGNVFLLREIYLMRLGERNAAALRMLAAFTRDDLWRGAPPPPIAAMTARVEAAAEALDGRPQAFLRLLDTDRATYAAAPPDPRKFGRTQGDAWFVLALEYAEAGSPDRALSALGQAVDLGSLYLPWALPYGPTEFPPAVRGTPAYAALWKSSPGLADLMKRRAAAARDRSARS